ncbi:heme peroxidase [Heliocybe sulcata]|uniref:Heme peroxidase n=1 Tax=Heliocybe sulcata TaxID=5364 RepID=A0A5C3MQS8_9AGAM|nr:heme peroxidase [Heliocybe sulcata]
MGVKDLAFELLALYVRVVLAVFRFAMSGILKGLQQRAEMLQESLAPVDKDGGKDVPDLLTKSLQDLVQVDARGLGFKPQDIPAYIDVLKNADGEGIDDRKFFLEKVLTLMARAPDNFGPTVKLQQAVIDLLYKDLPHPPSGYLSLPPAPSASAAPASINQSVSYAYRSADGSNYNPLFPSLGRANQPYARSVPSVSQVPRSALPDAGLVFDTLLRRPQGSFTPHPGGISSLFFAFADLIIHCLFNTDPRDWTKNGTSSYLDLSVLYGVGDEQVDGKRGESGEWEGGMRKHDGTGMIWEDAFADARLMLMPPAVGALLVLFNRNHNYIANRILSINENGNLVSPPPTDAALKEKQDAELFARARLVNCGYFMQVILADYVGAILGLARDGLSWRLNPLEGTRTLDHSVSPRGEGNAVSVEFNLMYRWHATTSQVDQAWTEKRFGDMWPGKSFEDITVDDFKNVAIKELRKAGDPRKWPLGDIQRNADGLFDDAQLAELLQNATAASASAFGARNTPEVLRIIEILGMEQARSWGVCTMNEFRKFMGLKPYADFKEWNPDPEIAEAAEALYHDIDNLELHVGMQAEETKLPMAGAGLCPGYTISRAILGDAVCLTRGDRFMTVDFTPFNFTSWGYQDCQINPDDGSYGGMLTKLLFRHLPEYYPRDSAYAFFPFMVPEYMKKEMGERDPEVVGRYSWEKPSAQQVGVQSLGAGALGGGDVYAERVAKVVKGARLGSPVVDKALFSGQQVGMWAKSFGALTKSLVDAKSIKHVGSGMKYVDVVKDVVNLVPVYWIANEVLGLPLKNVQNPRGSMREHETYRRFADVANYVFLNNEAAADFELRENSAEVVQEVVKRVERHLTRLKDGMFSVHGIVDTALDTADGLWAGRNERSDTFLKSLLAAASGTKVDAETLATDLTVEVLSTAALYSKTLALIVDMYLDDANHEARAEIVRLASGGTETVILGHVRHALGNTPSSGESYGLMNTEFFEKTSVEVLRTTFSLPGLARAPGTSGVLSKFSQNVLGTPEELYIDSAGKIGPWPASLVVQYN